MSNDQWKVVGKPKKEKALNKKNVQEEKKKAESGPKVENLLHSTQMKTLYSSVNMNHKQENKPPKEKVKEPAPKKQSQQQQQPKKQTTKNKKLSNQPKSPQWISQQLSSISVPQLRESYDFGKQQFSPVVRLSNLAAFLSSKIPFATNPDATLLKAIPKKIHTTLNLILNEAGTKNMQPFFEICLTTVANNINTGSSVFGYKLFVELLITNNPRLLLSSLNKIKELFNSYQNNKNVGILLIWYLSQAAEKNFFVGFEVFQTVLQNMIELKSYTPHLITYLKSLICRKIDKGAKTPSQLTSSLMFLFFFLYKINTMNLSKDVIKDLTSVKNELKKKIVEHRKELELVTVFEKLTIEIETNKNLSANTKDEWLVLCAQCVTDGAVLKYWTKSYNKFIGVTESIIVYIDNNWPKLQSKVDKKELQIFLDSFVKMATKKNGNKLDQAVKHSQNISKKMTVKRSFPYKTIIFLLILALGGVVFYDIHINGSYEKSETRKFLISSGIQEHAQTGLKYTIIYTKKAVAWGQENIPIYYGVTKDFLAPYGELAYDLFAFSVNVYNNIKEYVVEKIPVVTNFIESYAPGLVDKIVEISILVWTKVCEYFEIVRNYLATNVFVGQLSPDNLQKVTLQAINTTQVYAIQYYDWLSQKVQMLSDVK